MMMNCFNEQINDDDDGDDDDDDDNSGLLVPTRRALSNVCSTSAELLRTDKYETEKKALETARDLKTSMSLTSRHRRLNSNKYSSAVAKRPRVVSCLSVVSFNSTVTVSSKDIKYLHLYQMAVGMNGADND